MLALDSLPNQHLPKRIKSLRDMSFYLFRMVLCVVLVALSACTWVRDRSGEYVQAEEGKALLVPEQYDSSSIRPLYRIPESNSKNLMAEGFKLPEPPDATAVLNEAPFIVEHEETEGTTWLHLFTAPGRVWPLLDYFWRQHGIKIQFEEIAKGFVVTEAVDTSNPTLQQKLSSEQLSLLSGMRIQASLKQGVRRNTAELQIRTLSGGEDAMSWQEKNQQPELERGLLQLMGEFVTSDVLDSRYSLLANDIGGESRVRLLKDAVDSAYLEMHLSYPRAWSEISDALEAAGILIADLDRTERVFFISYLSEEEITRWYDFWGSAASKRQEHNFALRLSINEKGVVIVRVEQLNPDLDPGLKQELLNLVFEHIS